MRGGGPADQTVALEPQEATPDANKATDPSTKIAKPAKRQKAAPQPTEEDVAIVRPRESDDPVVSVLKDMFSIFSNDDDGGKAKRKRKDAVLVLPDANTKKKRKSNVKFMKLKPREH